VIIDAGVGDGSSMVPQDFFGADHWYTSVDVVV
jgi:hypothetical protein